MVSFRICKRGGEKIWVCRIFGRRGQGKISMTCKGGNATTPPKNPDEENCNDVVAVSNVDKMVFESKRERERVIK